MRGGHSCPCTHCCALIYLPAWQLHHYISTISRRAPIFPAEPLCGVYNRVRQPSQRERLALCAVYSRSIGGEKGDPSGRPRRYASFTSVAFVVSEEMEQFLSSPLVVANSQGICSLEEATIRITQPLLSSVTAIALEARRPRLKGSWAEGQLVRLKFTVNYGVVGASENEHDSGFCL